MVNWVTDAAILKLRDQIDEMAPNRRKGADGTIGDPDHQARTSAHNPQRTRDSQDGNDPDYQVDALDITHDPANGCDVGEIWEAIRQSRDRRVWLAIFNRRQFSSYARDGYPPYTWRPYTEEDPHTGHGHIEVSDYYNDDPTPWEIWMPSEADWKALTNRVDALIDMKAVNPYGDNLKPEKNVLAETMNKILAKVSEPGTPAPVDVAALEALVRRVVREELNKSHITG